MSSSDGGGEALKRRRIARLALPNDQDFPAGVLKHPLIAFVAGTVCLNFRDPVCGVGFNLAAAVDAVRTSVPEAAMDEDAHAAG